MTEQLPTKEMLSACRVVDLIIGWEHSLMVANRSDDWSAHQIEYCTNLRDTIEALRELQRLRRGEYICKACGLRKDGEIDGTPDF